MTNLGVRSLVAAIGIPLLLLASFKGGFLFLGVMSLISLVGLHEFYALTSHKGASPRVLAGLLLGTLFPVVFFHNRSKDVVAGVASAIGLEIPLPSMGQAFLIITMGSVLILVVLELFASKTTPLLNVASGMFGLMYVSVGFGSLVGLREAFSPADFPVSAHFGFHGLDVPEEILLMIDQWGGATIASIFASVWACDSAAYFAGRSFGKHKLLVRISPNKTIEGAVAGFVSSLVIFCIASVVLLPYLTMKDAFICGSVIGFFGQIGDLVESMLKRDAGLKDSSTILPGHGGILDRFDSLLLVSPVLFLYFDFIVFAR